MANTFRGEADIMLAGTDYTLRYNMSAIAELEKMQGASMAHMFSETNVEKSMSMDFIADALFVGLKRHYRNIAKQRILAYMDHSPQAEMEGWIRGISLGILRAMGHDISDQRFDEMASGGGDQPDPLKQGEETAPPLAE